MVLNYLRSLVGWLYSRRRVTLGFSAQAVPECLRWSGSGVPLWKLVSLSEALGSWFRSQKLVSLSEGTWEDGISDSWMVCPFWEESLWVLGSLCCRYCCLWMPASPLLILCSLTTRLLAFLLSSSLSQPRSCTAWFSRSWVFCHGSSWTWICTANYSNITATVTL